MDESLEQTLDVRDMLCSQALARVAQAAARCQPGHVLNVWINAADVKHDLTVWASQRGAQVEEMTELSLRISLR